MAALDPITLRNRLLVATSMWKETIAEPLPRLAPGDPADQIQSFELQLVDRLWESATPENRARALQLAASVDGVERVTQLLTLHLGPDVILLAMKIAFLPTLRVAEVEEVTDRIEARIREEMPQMRKIFIEADSHGDRRGVPATAGGA